MRIFLRLKLSLDSARDENAGLLLLPIDTERLLFHPERSRRVIQSLKPVILFYQILRFTQDDSVAFK